MNFLAWQLTQIDCTDCRGCVADVLLLASPLQHQCHIGIARSGVSCGMSACMYSVPLCVVAVHHVNTSGGYQVVIALVVE
jgi:hypothetical protein